MRRLYPIVLSLLLGGCSTFSDSEVIMRASPETRTSKPNMPPIEKPLQTAPIDDKTISIAPQIGLRLPLGK